MQQLESGSLLQGGRYKIEMVLGQGGFGITYLATQELLNRKVAIKEFFYKDYCERDEATSHVTLGTNSNRELVERFMEKFIKEARTISTLNHPHIIRIYDIFKDTHPLTGKDSRKGTPTSKACPGCPILCRRQFNKGADSQTDFLNQLGMDTVSAQDALAWASLAAESGILPESLPEQNQLFENIAYRRGLGNDLAEGIKYVSKKYNFKMPKTKKSAADKHNRNDGYPMILKGWGLDPEKMTPQMKLDCAILYTDLCEAVSAAGLCMFTVNAFCPEYLLTSPESRKSRQIHRIAPRSGAFLHRIVRDPGQLRISSPLFWQTELLNAVSGMELTPGNLLEAASRGAALEQLLCQRFGGNTDKLPKILKKEQNITLEDYFDARGWDRNGIPSEKK